ncbi:MAG: hypothetical protein Q4D38_10460 [Planctomycetia bacterium]|nr:hypothetical protein [Planctomycetia bacterium]
MQRFRKEGIFYENATNRFLNDLVADLDPKKMPLVADFTPRSGIFTNGTVEHFANTTKECGFRP